MNGKKRSGWIKGMVGVLAAAALAPVWAARVAQGIERPLSFDAVQPAAQRPFVGAELYRHADQTQVVPEIQVVRATVAYRSGGRAEPASAQQACEAWRAGLQRSLGSGAASVKCHASGRLGWATADNGDDTTLASAVVNYPSSPQPVTRNLSVVIVVCKPGQEYDGGRHQCYWPQNDGGGN